MSNQAWENWQDFEADEVVPYQRVVADPIQRRAVETALLSGADVDPKIVRAMGMGVGKGIIETQDVTIADHIPRVPYGGTESVHDIPASVEVPNDARANLPA